MKFYIVISLIVVALLSGCASKSTLSFDEKNQAYGDYIATNKLESLKRIKSFRLHGWQALTNDYLILSTSHRKKYLVEVTGFCPDLAHAQTIMINKSSSSILSTRFDSISVLNGGVGSHQIKCHIKTIHQIDKAQAKEIAAIGKQRSEAPTSSDQTAKAVTTEEA